MHRTIDFQKAGRLLRTAVDIADGTPDLAERRKALMECLAELTDSDSGHWAWMRGTLESEKILLVGFLHLGYAEEQLAEFFKFAFDPRVQQEMRQRLQKELGEHPRSDRAWSVISRDVLPEINVEPDHWIRQAMNRIGVGCWMQGGRFLPGQVESTLTLGRRPGKPDYDDGDRELMDLAITHVPWLWASPDETVPQKDIEALSPRQRAVAFLLLDGLGRKQIAARLGIGEETVNHHAKGIFRHFSVKSATELAALFLRSQ